MRTAPWMLLFLGLLSACSTSDTPRGPDFELRDSAGVQIVTNYSSAWSGGEAWTVSRRPLAIIGDLDGPLEFTFGTVRAVGWLSDGRIFVSDEQADNVRIFAPDGTHLSTLGRSGDGPGEFKGPWRVSSYRGDSLYVYDHIQETVSIFAPDLSFVRRVRNPIVGGNYWVRGDLADGRFLLYSPGQQRRGGSPQTRPDSSWIIAVAADGSTADTLGAFQLTLSYTGPDTRGYRVMLAPNAAFAAAGDRIIWAEGKEFEYVEADPSGTVIRIVRKAHEPIPVTDDIIEEFKTQYLESLGSGRIEGGAPGAMDRMRQYVDDASYHHRLPATAGEALKIDALGYVWVGRYHYPGALTLEWEVFDPSGIWMGMVETPPGLEVHEISRDQIIGIAKGDFDVPYVQVYRLDRG